MRQSTTNWLLLCLTVLLSGFFAFMNLHEFIVVGVQKRTGGYPFGGEGPFPWYYKTAQLYANVCLGFGLAFLSLLVSSLLCFLRNKKYMPGILLAAIIFLIIIQILDGQS